MPADNPERPNDHTDYAQRRRTNIIVAVGLSALLGLLIWTVQAFQEYERLQRCYASGRRNCEKIDIPQVESPGVFVPVR